MFESYHFLTRSDSDFINKQDQIQGYHVDTFFNAQFNNLEIIGTNKHKDKPLANWLPQTLSVPAQAHRFRSVTNTADATNLN